MSEPTKPDLGKLGIAKTATDADLQAAEKMRKALENSRKPWNDVDAAEKRRRAEAARERDVAWAALGRGESAMLRLAEHKGIADLKVLDAARTISDMRAIAVDVALAAEDPAGRHRAADGARRIVVLVDELMVRLKAVPKEES